MASPSTAGPGVAEDKLDPRVWKVAAVVLLAPLMAHMDSTIVNVSLSTIRDDLHASFDSAHWIVGGYLLALALALPVNGWLVDRLGAKRLYLWCFSAFTVASACCGAARTMDQLILARVVQGVAGGLLAPMTQMMIAKVAGRHMARVLSYTVMPVLLAPILGPSVAGAILKYGSWPWLFYVNVPIGVFAIAMAAYLLPPEPPSARRRAFDLGGFLLISPGLVCLLYGLDNYSTRRGAIALGAGAFLLVAFALHARRKKAAALVDLRLFRIRIFSVATTTQLLSNAVSFAGQLLMPLYLIAGCGLSPQRAAVILAVMGLGMLVSYASMGFLTDRLGCRAVAAGGALLNVVSTLPILAMAFGPFNPAVMMVCLFFRGAGQGATGVPSLAAGYSSVPRESLALATTASNIAQRVGGPIGTTTIAIVIAASETATHALGPHTFTLALTALLMLQVMVFASAMRLPLRVHQQEPQSAE